MNSNFGHEGGDSALKTFAINALQIFGSENNKMFRLSGDEFVLISSDNEDTLKRNVELLRSYCRNRHLKIVKNGKLLSHEINFSYGYTKSKKGDTVETMKTRADDYMYEEKKRHHVVSVSEDDQSK